MEKQKHTPEPWEAESEYGNDDLGYIAVIVQCGDDKIVAADILMVDALRAVACVNALAGMNPEAVADVVAVLERIVGTANTAGETGHREAAVVAGNWDVLGPQAHSALSKLRSES